MPAPKVRDVRKLADSRAVFELDIPLEALPGLPAEFLSAGGPLRARLSFGREQGFAAVQVQLQGQLTASCQRCLGPLPLQVDTSSRVLVVESAQEADSAPAGWETFLAPEGRLVFEALAIEELLLALPIVPLHERASACLAPAPQTPAVPDAPGATQTAAGGTESEARHAPARGEQSDAAASARPFAELRALLERAAKDR